MEYMPKWKMAKAPRPNLFEPPAYCRTTNRNVQMQVSTPPVKLDVSDPSKLLFFVESLKDNNSKGLERKINKYLQKESESQNTFLINVTHDEAYIQVIGANKLKYVQRSRVPKTVIDEMNETYKTPECRTLGELDPIFQAMMKQALENKHCTVVTVPILTPESSTLTVILVCIVNSKKDNFFIVHLVNETFRFCLTVLLNTMTSEEELKTKLECQTLLDIARKLFTHLDDLTDLLKEIMSGARNMTNAERCSLFLLDESNEYLVAKVFDGSSSDRTKEVKVPRSTGIAGHVATTGEILNIKNAYEHPLFYKGLDERTGFKTRNILCFPIRNTIDIIGVAQLCNKKEGDFTVDDEESAVAFSIYCGLSIMHSLVYKKTQEAQVRTQLSNELMMYHMKVEDGAVARTLQCTNPHNIPNFENLNFSPRVIPLSETVCYVMKMFEHLKLINKFDINKETLSRFILYVQKGYRSTPYHNWYHALCVAHFIYTAIRNFKMLEYGYISSVEALALLTAALGHDIDHRGTTNAFQVKVGSPLANLYSSEGSVMERHHLAQTLCILNSHKCNFLESLDNSSFRRCLDLLRDNILSTDLANHFKIIPKLTDVLVAGYVKDNLEHKKLLLSLMMTCADLSDQTKGFIMAKQVAQMVYEEFFTQGDLEKNMGKIPIEMMDRERASIPDLQIQFLNDVCLPAYVLLAQIFPKAQQFVDIMETTKECWEASKAVFERHLQEGKGSFEVLMTVGLEKEVITEMKGEIIENVEEEEGTAT